MTITDAETTATDHRERIAVFERMTLMRLFERRIQTLFLENGLNGPAHLSTGQEAVAAAFGAVLDVGDYTLSTYRSHAQILARGVPMDRVFAELMGRDGLLGGKGGSMHLTSVEHGHLGAYAIVGAHLPIAVGSAWASQLRGDDRVTVCFFGDGATNIGAFHEALNLAAVWGCPVVFVCENNLYMEYTRTAEVTAVEHPAADRAAGYGLPPVVVDGNDADAVLAVARAAVDRARAGGGPALIEAMTYRHSGHAQADPAKYRPAGELEAWVGRDPVTRYRERLVEEGVDEAVLDGIEAAIAAEVDDALARARTCPLPNTDRLLTDLWADGGSSWRR